MLLGSSGQDISICQVTSLPLPYASIDPLSAGNGAVWRIDEQDYHSLCCYSSDEINERITQVLSADYRVDIPWGEQSEAVNRLRYVAPFLGDIAAVRVREMSRRASRGALLVREIDRRQHKLAEDILGGFVTADFLLHFPPIEGLLVDMELMAEWFKIEVGSVTNLTELRSAKFGASNRRNEEQGNLINHGIIWTKWGRYDTRSDPWGREAICWDLKNQRLVNSTVEKRCGLS
ncbi:uncharacterized protein FPRN_14662 [Fusarium proliferatum]|nr:uncharacterized protein FPRN_14662 [Fusarium proliferatum]